MICFTLLPTQQLVHMIYFTLFQTQQLVHMICYPSNTPNTTRIEDDDEDIDNKETINHILQELDPWTLRVSLLELQLMFKQAKHNAVSVVSH